METNNARYLIPQLPHFSHPEASISSLKALLKEILVQSDWPMRVDAIAQNSLVTYALLISAANKYLKLLTMHRPASILQRYIPECLPLCQAVKGNAVLDVSNNAGFPAIPLAILQPRLKVTLLEPRPSKVRFLEQVKRMLALENVTILPKRLETLGAEVSYHTVIARHQGNLAALLEHSQRLTEQRGELLALRGIYPHAELVQLDQPYQVTTFDVGEQGRHLVIIPLEAKRSDQGRKSDKNK